MVLTSGHMSVSLLVLIFLWGWANYIGIKRASAPKVEPKLVPLGGKLYTPLKRTTLNPKPTWL